jgi:hypothetical protein
MVFNAAKDLVYTINGGNISSGGYRINKILNGKSKKKGKQTQDGGGEYSSIFKEDSGIPIGLLLMQRLHENKHDNGVKNKENNATLDENENKKLVHASIMAESDDDGDGRVIELVIMPSGIANPIEISSNEIDDEIYDSLVKSVTGPEQMMVSTPFRKANATKKQKDIKIKTIYQKGKKTRSKRRH